MAWTTSGNLREIFGSRDYSATSTSHSPPRPVQLTSHPLRRLAVIALATAHLALLGELAFVPITADQKLASAASAIGPVPMLSWPWLGITGLMLAILWLARDWPTTPTVAVAPPVTTTERSPRTAFDRPGPGISTQNKADPMTGLLARVSHDLRTPLTAVMGFSDLMQQEAFGPLGDKRYQSYARHIHNSSAELLKAAEDTLAMTALVASQRTVANEIIDLNDLISDAFTMALLGTAQPFARASAAPLPPIMLASKIPLQLQVTCERRPLRQAMINLMSAAMSKVVPTTDGMRTVHAVAATTGDVVCLTLSIAVGARAAEAGSIAASWNSADDLPICLARALLELQDLHLTLISAPDVWSAQVVLDSVSQCDFFAT